MSTYKTPNRCSICDSDSITHFGSKDFSYICNDSYTKAPTLPASGNIINYFQCNACKFIFTPHFDAWSPDQFRTEIYNSDYILADPEFNGDRAIKNAQMLDRLLCRDSEHMTLLDFGGGNGAMATQLRSLGFDAYSYDQFYDAETELGNAVFDFITSFEVVEHVPHSDQLPWFEAVAARLKRTPSAKLFFSTDLSLPDAAIDWHYIAPRNGHISFHSPVSLAILANKVGLTTFSVSSMWHFCTWPTIA